MPVSSPLPSSSDDNEEETKEDITKEAKQDENDEEQRTSPPRTRNSERIRNRNSRVDKNNNDNHQHYLASSPSQESTSPDTTADNTEFVIETRRKKMDAHVTSGCGTGKKRAELVDGFWNVIWPRLENEAGWTKVDGKGRLLGSISFIPCGSSAKGKKGLHYYDRIRDVIDRVLERRNEAEAAIADVYLEEFGTIYKSEAKYNNVRLSLRRPLSKRTRREPTSPSEVVTSSSRSQRQPPKERLDLSWKYGGKHFQARSSRVGDRFQATDLPAAASYTQEQQEPDEDDGNCYDQIWDPHIAKAKGAIDIIEKVLPSNKREGVCKKEGALIALHEMGYDPVKFKKALASGSSQIAIMNGSDWSWKEKEQFHEEIFRSRKNIGAVSKSIQKSVQACMAYYLGTYKSLDDYLVLKTVCLEEKRNRDSNRARKNQNSPDACAVCSGGGKLLICDACEGEYHLACLRPELQCVPEGKWECDECVDRKFLAARDYIIQNTTLFEKVQVSKSTYTNGSTNNATYTPAATAVEDGVGVSTRTTRSKRKRESMNLTAPTANNNPDVNNNNAAAVTSESRVSGEIISSDEKGKNVETVLRPTKKARDTIATLAEIISDAFSDATS